MGIPINQKCLGQNVLSPMEAVATINRAISWRQFGEGNYGLGNYVHTRGRNVDSSWFDPPLASGALLGFPRVYVAADLQACMLCLEPYHVTGKQ